MPPATAMWLSLIRIASSSPKRWLKPPPQRTAYFSSARSPGVVLRVQQMRVRVPVTRRTNSWVAVATPERWPTRLSATRSAARTARASPVTSIGTQERVRHGGNGALCDGSTQTEFRCARREPRRGADLPCESAVEIGPQSLYIAAMSLRSQTARTSSLNGWRTPTLIVLCGCMIALLSFGPRSTLGFFLTPQSQANGWGRDVFGLAPALQNIIWGLGQPVAGMLADRFGIVRVLCAGGVFYALGLATMAVSTTPLMLDFSAGVLIGFGLAGCSFGIVLSAFGKLLPPRWRSLAFGAGTAAGSFGQLFYAPVAVSLIDAIGWQETLGIFAAVMIMVLPLSLALATGGADATPRSSAPQQSLRQALSEAFGQRSYTLLVLGYFTCG